MKPRTPALSRRQFLKIAGIVGVAALPSVLAYDLLHDAQGETPSSRSPYVPSEALTRWPTQPSEASPLLVILDEHAENPFGAYVAEILRAEGLNAFQVGKLSDLEEAPLDWYDIVVLAETATTPRQAERLESWVSAGGSLVAMRPDKRLSHLFGVEPLAGTLAEGYLQVERSHPAGSGIASETLQFHGVADTYRLAGAQVVAWLASDAATRTTFPSVTLNQFGKGRASMWAFDLARSIAYTRQGNPNWANQERDGGDGIRPSDMFAGWVDLDRLAIPQADEQQRLLANLLSLLSQNVRPLPRLWYFPAGAESVFVATGDSHGNPAFAVAEALTHVESHGGRISIYYTAFPENNGRRALKRGVARATSLPFVGHALTNYVGSPTSAHVAGWRARGHEFGLHPYVEEGLADRWRQHWEEFTGLGYGPVPPTVRTHRILWTGWTETARLQASLGMRMNLDYYHWGPAFQKVTGEWAHGHFTGSGLPMKFIDEQGRRLSIYQQLTQLADDHLLDLHWGGVERIRAEEALQVSRTLIDRSLAAGPCAITANFHVDPFTIRGKWLDEAIRWLDGTLGYAASAGVPILPACDWLHFTETRHDSNLTELQWDRQAKRLIFQLNSHGAPDVALAVMVPLQHGESRLAQLVVDGVDVRYRPRSVGGASYGWAAVQAGIHQVTASYV